MESYRVLFLVRLCSGLEKGNVYNRLVALEIDVRFAQRHTTVAKTVIPRYPSRTRFAGVRTEPGRQKQLGTHHIKARNTGYSRFGYDHEDAAYHHSTVDRRGRGAATRAMKLAGPIRHS
jgi:hypothetical protein